MRYSDLVILKITANDLLLDFSRYIGSTTPQLCSVKEHQKLKNKGSFSFDTSSLSEESRKHVLSFAEESLYNSYVFKIKHKDYGTVYYERAINGITVSVLKFAVVLGFLLLAVILFTLGYFLFN